MLTATRGRASLYLRAIIARDLMREAVQSVRVAAPTAPNIRTNDGEAVIKNL